MELTIIVAIIAFLAVTLLLVGLLLFAKAKLTSSGEVTIDINGGEKVITTESGSTLLATLANNKVFLPSACGGGGSCGMCKCQVIEGGGDILRRAQHVHQGNGQQRLDRGRGRGRPDI